MFFVSTPVLHSIAYFDIFDHPLRKAELVELCAENKHLDTTLETLVNEGKCFNSGEFYSLSKNIDSLIAIRLEKEKRAKKYLKKLRSYAKLISKFPYIKGLAVSGSLSKNVMHDDGDIDYFIITAKNRLWICRTFLILFKKVFLLNSRKYFCVNYFVDEANLEIKDKNMFTAIELTYLLPVYNTTVFNSFIKENSWLKEYYTPINHPISFNAIKQKGNQINWIEKLLGTKLSDKLDLFFMSLTIKRWKKKFSHFDAEKMELTMRSNRGISKHHPSDFQSNVLKEYAKRLKKLNIEDESIIYA